MSSVELWRIQPFYDFSPGTPGIRDVQYASPFTLPAQNGDIDWEKESFSGELVSRSITGRTRSNIAGNRLIGSMQWNDLVDDDDKFKFLSNLYFSADVNNPDRLFSIVAPSASVTSATITLTTAAGQPAPSSVDNYYTSMFITSGPSSLPSTGPEIRRITAYDGTTKVATLSSTFTVSTATALYIWAPQGIPFGFYLNTTNTATGQVACIVNGTSTIGFKVQNRIIQQPIGLDFQSRDLIYESFVFDAHPFIRYHN